MALRRILLLVASAALAAGCGMQKKEPPPKPFVGTKWVVQLELPVQGEQPWVRFGDGRMEGFGGCSQFHAHILQDSVGAKAIAIKRIELRQQGVCEANVVAAERRMLATLQDVSAYAISVDVMKMSGSGGTLVLRAVSLEAMR